MELAPGTKRLALFGGTFNPVHAGHLLVASFAVEQLELDRLFFLPARVPPHKHYTPAVPDAVRLRLLAAATAADPRFGILELELHREGPSFTIDTVAALRDEGYAGEIHLLIGEDQLAGLAAWRDSARLFREVRFLIAPRDHGVGTPPVGDLPAGVRAAWLDCPRFSVSSSGIRQRLVEGRGIRYLVPEEVRSIIMEEGLYQ